MGLLVAVCGARVSVAGLGGPPGRGAGERDRRIRQEGGEGAGAGARRGRCRPAWATPCSPDAGARDGAPACAGSGRRSRRPRRRPRRGQPMVNTGYLDEAAPLARTFVSAFEGYDHVVVPSGSCAGSARHQHSLVAGAVGRRCAGGRRVAHLAAHARAVGVPGGRARGGRRGGVVRAPGDLPPDLPLLADAAGGDRPTRLLAAVRGIDLVPLPRAQECCGFGGTFAVKNAETSVAMGSDKAAHVRSTGAEGVRGGRQLVPHAHRGLALATACGRADPAPRRGPRMHRPRAGGAAAMTRFSALPQSSPHPTFLGTPPFPASARTALADTQLRRNLAHATGTIRAKRAAVVAEVDNWEALRQRAARIKDDTLAHLDDHLVTLESALTEAAAPRCTGRETRATRARWWPTWRSGTASVTSSRSSRWRPRRSA